MKHLANCLWTATFLAGMAHADLNQLPPLPVVTAPCVDRDLYPVAETRCLSLKELIRQLEEAGRGASLEPDAAALGGIQLVDGVFEYGDDLVIYGRYDPKRPGGALALTDLVTLLNNTIASPAGRSQWFISLDPSREGVLRANALLANERVDFTETTLATALGDQAVVVGGARITPLSRVAVASVICDYQLKYLTSGRYQIEGIESPLSRWREAVSADRSMTNVPDSTWSRCWITYAGKPHFTWDEDEQFLAIQDCVVGILTTDQLVDPSNGDLHDAAERDEDLADFLNELSELMREEPWRLPAAWSVTNSLFRLSALLAGAEVSGLLEHPLALKLSRVQFEISRAGLPTEVDAVVSVDKVRIREPVDGGAIEHECVRVVLGGADATLDVTDEDLKPLAREEESSPLKAWVDSKQAPTDLWWTVERKEEVESRD